MLKLINGIVGVACFAILGSDVLAATQDYKLHRELSMVSAYKVGLNEAVSIAETRVNGRAVDVHLVSFAGRDAWDIDVMNGERKIVVWVDACNGNVDITAPSHDEP